MFVQKQIAERGLDMEAKSWHCQPLPAALAKASSITDQRVTESSSRLGLRAFTSCLHRLFRFCFKTNTNKHSFSKDSHRNSSISMCYFRITIRESKAEYCQFETGRRMSFHEMIKGERWCPKANHDTCLFSSETRNSKYNLNVLCALHSSPQALSTPARQGMS